MAEAMRRANPAATNAETEVWGFPLTCMVFSRTGALLLTGCTDGNCHVFEISTSVCRMRLVRSGKRAAAAAAAVRCCR